MLYRIEIIPYPDMITTNTFIKRTEDTEWKLIAHEEQVGPMRHINTSSRAQEFIAQQMNKLAGEQND